MTHKNDSCIFSTNTEENVIVTCDSVQYKDINNTVINVTLKNKHCFIKTTTGCGLNKGKKKH